MKKMFKIGCGAIVAFFALIIIIAVFAGGGDTNDTAESDSSKPTENTDSTSTANEKAKEESSDKKTEDEVVTVGIGQPLTVEDVEFIINNSEIVTQIKDGTGYITETPSADGAKFLIIDATVKNLGKEKINTDGSFFKVLTADGITYEASSIWFDGFFLFEEINPGLAQSGKIAFEIPEGLTDLSVQVQTGFWGTETGIIKLD